MTTSPELKPGSLRYKNKDGAEVIVSPGDPTYSLALFVAQEFWNGEQWVNTDAP